MFLLVALVQSLYSYTVYYSAVDIPALVTLGTRTRDPEGLYSGVEIYPGVEVERVEAVSWMYCFLTQMPRSLVSILPALPAVALLF